MTANTSTPEFSPADGVGAYVTGIDLNKGTTAEQASAMREGLGRYGVLFFRDQHLAPEKHIEMAERFGQININRFFHPVDGYPNIAEVRKDADQKLNIGGDWHTDHSYDTEPALGSILLARDLPDHGGDTLFANMYAAFDSLSDGLKDMLRQLRAVHSSRHRFGAQAQQGTERAGRLGNYDAATQDAVHPVVIHHPISGREALYVNLAFTLRFEGWTDEESAPLLAQLYRHASRPEFTHRFKWEPGSIAFWDNRATWHYAVNDYHGQARLMHRITIEGQALS